jgi:hypothetical protein
MTDDEERIRRPIAAAILRGAGTGRLVRDRVLGRHRWRGDDVAYAHALLRCGTRQELAEDPENRLRLTLGLRK